MGGYSAAVRIDDHGLLQALHRGIFETPLWADFLARLRAHCGADSVTMILQRPSDEPLFLHAGKPLTPSMANLEAMRPGRVYDDRLEAAVAMRAIRADQDGWLLIGGGRNVGPATGALLSALAPHLAIAVQTYSILERERYRSIVTEHTIGRLKMGWLTLDHQCRILEATPNVEQLFQWGTLLRRGRYDRLVPAAPALDRQLTALVKGYGVGEGRAQAFRLSEDPFVDMLVTPAQEAGLARNGRAAAIIYVSGDRRSQADRCDQLVDLFGLLPSEARLAWLMAQATSIADAAAMLGLTVETARNYSKKIYAKTGARGHAELVRIILTGVLAVS